MPGNNIVGYDINDTTCQISYYNDETKEPETLDYGHDICQIPLAMNYYNDEWTFGRNALRMNHVRGSVLVEDLFEKALRKEKLVLEENEYECVWILAEFIKRTLEPLGEIDSITFTVPEMNEDIRYLLKGIGLRIGIDKDKIYIQDYKESFCHYMFNQPKELWQYEAALFYCSREEICAYMLRELSTDQRKGGESFVTVDKVAAAKMEELECVYPVMDVDEAKAADEHFKEFINSIFNKKRVSSVFLTGEGFENNWYPNSLRVLCNGRRAFMGNNLYSKGACYKALSRNKTLNDTPVYLDDSKLTEQISIRMRVNAIECWYPLVAWGSHWYEADNTCEVLLENTEAIELHVESLAKEGFQTYTVSFEGLPERNNYAIRLRIHTMFIDEKTCRIEFSDIGFGEFFPSSGYSSEVIIELGGGNGEFNSLS